MIKRLTAHLEIGYTKERKLKTNVSARRFLVNRVRIVNDDVSLFDFVALALNHGNAVTRQNEKNLAEGMLVGLFLPLLDALKLSRVQTLGVELDNVYF